MVMPRLHRFPELRRFHARVFSAAFALNLIVIFLLIIIPLLVAFYSFGLYINVHNYYERPSVKFMRVVAAKIQAENEEVLLTNHHGFLTLPYQSKEWQPLTLTSWEEEEKQALELNIRIPFALKEPIQSIVLLLYFHVGLYNFAVMETPLVAVVAESTQEVGSGLRLVSDLIIEQNRILPSVGTITPYALEYPSSTGSEYFEDTIRLTYDTKRAVRIHLKHRLIYWTPLDTTRHQFMVNATINYVHSQLSARPGFWYVLKFAWIQYLTIALVFFYFGEKIRAYVYSQQLVTTTMVSTLQSKRDA